MKSRAYEDSTYYFYYKKKVIIIKRFTVEEVESNQFYQMPKFLFNAEFKHLSNDARVLYSLLRDRHQLSIKNKWINNNGEVYMIYTRLEMADKLGITDKTVLKAVNKLKEYELLEETRQGINKPNILYLTHVTVENTGQVKIPCQDKEIFRGSKTDYIKTEKKVLHYLKELNNEYVNSYIEIMQNYYHKCKRVSVENLHYIEDSINYILENGDVDIELWSDNVDIYFRQLQNSNSDNDGDILAFLKASKRIFDIDIAI